MFFGATSLLCVFRFSELEYNNHGNSSSLFVFNQSNFKIYLTEVFGILLEQYEEEEEEELSLLKEYNGI